MKIILNYFIIFLQFIYHIFIFNVNQNLLSCASSSKFIPKEREFYTTSEIDEDSMFNAIDLYNNAKNKDQIINSQHVITGALIQAVDSGDTLIQEFIKSEIEPKDPAFWQQMLSVANSKKK